MDRLLLHWSTSACNQCSALFHLAFLLKEPSIDVLVPHARSRLLTPRQTRVLNPGIRVFRFALRAHEEYIIFPELDFIAAHSALLRADILWFEVCGIHSRASFSH